MGPVQPELSQASARRLLFHLSRDKSRQWAKQGHNLSRDEPAASRLLRGLRPCAVALPQGSRNSPRQAACRQQAFWPRLLFPTLLLSSPMLPKIRPDRNRYKASLGSARWRYAQHGPPRHSGAHNNWPERGENWSSSLTGRVRQLWRHGTQLRHADPESYKYGITLVR